MTNQNTIVAEALARLEGWANTLPRPLSEVVRFVLDNPRFGIAPASSDDPNSGHKHHAYRGGLAVHTLEVLEKALAMGAFTLYDERRLVLIVAAIWHDFAKIHEYQFQTEVVADATILSPAGQIIKTPYKKLIGHVPGSYAEFLGNARAVKLDPNLTERIGHCILAHHGRLEWHSPVEPQTEEAFILHAADMWSCQYGPRKDGLNELQTIRTEVQNQSSTCNPREHQPGRCAA